MEIVMLVVIIGGAWLLWPHISSAIGGIGGDNAAINAVQTDSEGNDTKVSTGTKANADEIRARTQRMIDEITAKARRGSGGGGMVQTNTGGGGGSNISVSGSGARACANGRCVSAYGEMTMDFSNVV